MWKLVTFLSPLMLVLGVQRISRPMVNLLVARFSSSCEQAAEVTITELFFAYALMYFAEFSKASNPIPRYRLDIQL